MGRITIFTAEGCPHCKRVEAALHMRDIPFVLIEVSTNPKRRADMVALCDRTSTPQVFFNTAHIGGADETLQILQKWDDELQSKNNYTSPLHRYQVEIASNFDPVNPRFAIPQSETESPLPRPEQALSHLDERQSSPQQESPEYSSSSSKLQSVAADAGCGAGAVIVLPNGQKLSILEVTETLKRILPRTDHIRRPMLYKMTFTRSEAVQAWSSHYGLSSLESGGEAMEFGRSLQQLQILHSIPHQQQQRGGGGRRKKEHDLGGGGDTETAKTTATDQKQQQLQLFRLQCDDQPHVLNSYRVWRSHATDPASSSDADVVADHAMKLVNRLKDLIMEIEYRVTDNDGGIHYTKVFQGDHDDQHLAAMYTQFEEAVCELQTVNMVLLNDKTKKVFCMNLYNLMIKYAFMKLGAARTSVSRHAFFSTVGFDVGGHYFSFQDFENGLLRGNRRPPYSLRLVQFSKHDARRSLVVQNPDFRFHFGVNCGAQSCPPVRNFSVDDLDNELQLVARSFCEDDANVLIDENKNEISVSKIFYWYKVDFVGDNNVNKQLPVALVEYLRGAKLRTLEKMINSNEAIKVSFLPYDWTPNIKNVKTFNPADLKLDVWGYFSKSTETTSSSSS